MAFCISAVFIAFVHPIYLLLSVLYSFPISAAPVLYYSQIIEYIALVGLQIRSASARFQPTSAR